jgi:hypothetical protein
VRHTSPPVPPVSLIISAPGEVALLAHLSYQRASNAAVYVSGVSMLRRC